MRNRRIITILVIFTIIFTLMGGTLAYLNWQSTTAQRTNVAFTVQSNFSCAADIGGNVSSTEANLIPTSDCTSEDYAIQRTVTVRPTLSANAPADLTISMDLWLEVESITSGVSNSSNFRYALTTSSTSCETGIVSSGNFKGTSEGSRLSLLSSNEYNATTTETYYLYIWLDELETDSSTMNQTFELSINGECINETKEAYAVYSETDNSLRFYKSVEPLSVGDTYTAKVNGVDTELTATAVYTGFESKTSQNSPAWYSNRKNITTVVVEDTIKPKSIYHWFYFFENATYIDVSKLNTSSVTNMDSMFINAGYNSTTFEIKGLENWDVSSVTNMDSMFYMAGYSATTWSIGDISGWDVSSVTNMDSMFYSTGGRGTTWSIGDLSGWDTSSVTNMYRMFHMVGRSATTWSIGDISGWDVSSVTNMSSMFSSAGYNATTWSIGDLSGWDVSSVTDMNNMFYMAGNKATTWSIGDLSGWDTSNVTNMSKMFMQAGYKATNFNLNLSGWDVSGVTNMLQMFQSAGNSATTFELNLSDWDVSSVTNMSSMFYFAGYNSTTFEIKGLENWDTSSVTDMSSMFYYVGCNASYSLDLSTKEVTRSDGTTYTAWDVTNVGSNYTNFAGGVTSKITQPSWVS